MTGEAKDKDISWFSPNGEKLTPNQQRISVVRNDDSSSTLTIYNTNIDDAGIYKCVVSSAEEGESEATVNVKIFRRSTALTFDFAWGNLGRQGAWWEDKALASWGKLEKQERKSQVKEENCWKVRRGGGKGKSRSLGFVWEGGQ